MNDERIPNLDVNGLVSLMGESYVRLIETKTPFRDFPSLMLWGAPGVGKSQSIRQMGKLIEAKTGKKVNITDVRLMLFNPIDLRGIPTVNEDRTLSVWLRPKIFDMDPSEDVVNILFLDEISAAPQSVQAAAYQITLDRVVGEHKLPENCIVIAAGNRVSDKSVAYKMPKALANRMLHIEVNANFKSWKKWAEKKGIDPRVVAFLSFRPDLLNANDDKADDLAFPTPRSWEMVSNALNGGDINQYFPLVQGLIGTGSAVEFRTYCRVFDELPSIDDIVKGVEVEVPNRPDRLYALSAALSAKAKELISDMNSLDNIIDYINLMPNDFAVLTMNGILSVDENMKNKLLNSSSYQKYLLNKCRVLNGRKN
ncbi:MAG: MoxR family ATPase [Bacilli bacterium]|nr:MoxR family ATPase [Bacilli bacterium]